MLDWQKHPKLRIFVKIVCVALTVSFLAYDLAWAGAAEVLSPKYRQFSQNAQSSPTIEIPQELGIIKESYTSKYNPYKLVIHIQDAHANPEAQENEARLIKYLKDKYRVNLVSVEGGFGDFDAGFFRGFPKDKKVREKIARYFLARAFISGTDYLLITEDEPPAVYGAEDKELYTTHLNTFRENQHFSHSLNRSLGAMESVIKTLKNKYYSRDLKELDSRVNDFRQGRTSLEDYLSYLNILSITHSFDLSRFPNLSRIIKLQELEHKINFEKAESERRDLIDALAGALSKQGLEGLVKNSLDFKADKLTPGEYYSYLEGLARDAAIQVKDYAHLFNYIQYVSLSGHLENSRVFAEMEAFTEALKEKFITTLTQKDLNSLTYIIQILKGLSNINLLPKDYEYFKKNRDAFTSNNIGLVLRRYNSSIANFLPADKDISSLEKFYSLAYERNNAIVSNSLNRLNRDYGSNSVILVAGGFHTQGITSILKEKDVSYVVVAPKIKTADDRETAYFSLLKEKRLSLSDILNDPDTLQIINSISDPEARQLLVNYWVARASRYYSLEELQAQLNRLHLSKDDQQAAQDALQEISSQSQFTAIPASHKEVKKTPEGITAGAQEQTKAVPAPAPKTKQSYLKRFILSFVMAFMMFILTGCASTLYMRVGPLQLRNDTVVSLSEPQEGEKIIDLSGRLALGPGQIIDANTAKGRLDLTVGAKAKAGPLTVGLEPTLSVIDLKPGAPALDLRFNLRPEEKEKTQAPPSLKEPLALKGQIKTEALPAPAGEETFSPVREKLADLDNRLFDQENKLNVVREEKAGLEEKASGLERALSQNNSLIQKIQQEAAKKQKALEELRMQQERAQAAFSAALEELAKANQANQQAKLAVERLDNEQRAAQERIQALAEKNQALESDVSGLKERLDISEKRLSQAEERIASLEKYQQHWWRSLGTGWKLALSVLAGLGVGLAFLRIGLYSSWRRLTRLKTEIAQTKAEKLELEKELAASKAALGDLANETAESKVSLDEAKEKCQAQAEAIQQAKLELAGLEIGPEKDIPRQEKLKQRIEQMQKEALTIARELSLAISGEENKISALKANITRMEKDQARHEGAARDLKKKAEECQDLIRVLEQKRNKAGQELALLEEVSAAKAQIAETSQKLQEAEKTLEKLKEEAASLETQKKNLEAEVAGRNARKSKLDSEISALDQKAQGLTQTVADLQAEKDNLARKENELKAGIDEKTGQLKAIEERLAGLQAQGKADDFQFTLLKKEKLVLEEEIARLSQYVADLSREAAKAKTNLESTLASLDQLEGKRKTAGAALENLENSRAALSFEVSGLKTEKSNLTADLVKLRQELTATQQEALAKRSPLDKEINGKEKDLEELKLKISGLTGQKTRLEQEIEVILRKKQEEGQGLAKAEKERAEINKKIALAQEQLGRITSQLENFLNTIDELKERGVNLNQEIPALASRRDDLAQALSNLEKLTRDLETNLIPIFAIPLPKPYAAMLFDVDNTLTDITTAIDKGLLKIILDLLEQNVQIALVTAQSIKETRAHIIDLVPKERMSLLKNLSIYPSGGAKCYQFDEQGVLKEKPVYDAAEDLSRIIQPEDIERILRPAAGRSAEISFRDGLITISGIADREDTLKKLPALLKQEGLYYIPRIAGGHSLHLLIVGVDKAKAATHFISRLSKEVFKHEVPSQRVLTIGDSFYAGGLDADLITALPHSHIVSVGRKPKGRQLAYLKVQGVRFSEDLVGLRSWPATLKILGEVRNGKNIDEIGIKKSGNPGVPNNLASFILALTLGAFSVLSSTITNAEVPLSQAPPQVQATAAGSQTEAQLAEVFTTENYRGDIAKIDQAIKLINDRKIAHPKIIESLKWVMANPDVPENKYYPHTTKNAAIALLQTDAGREALAEVLKDPVLLTKSNRFGAVLTAIEENKPIPDSVLQALEEVMLKPDNTVKAYFPLTIKLAARTLIQSGEKGVARIINSLDIDNYCNNSIQAEVFEAIAEAKLKNPEMLNKLYWLVMEAAGKAENSAIYYYERIGNAAAKALYEIERDKALQKFSEVLTTNDWRARDGAARAIIAIAKTPAGKLDTGVINALKEVQKLGPEHDSREFVNKEAEAVLKELAPAKIEFFTPQRYADSPQEMILDAETFAQEQNLNFAEEMARAIAYTDHYHDFNQDVLKACVESLLKSGDKGIETLSSVFNSDNYRKAPHNLKAAIEIITERQVKNPRLIAAIASIAGEPDIYGSKIYFPDLNKSAVQGLIKLGDPGITALTGLLTPRNYDSHPAQLAIIIDTLAEARVRNPELVKDLLVLFYYTNADGSRNNALRVSLINAFSKLGVQEALEPLLGGLSDTNEEVRQAAISALVSLKASPEKFAGLVNSDNPLLKDSARQILKAIAPDRLEELTKPAQPPPPEEARGDVFGEEAQGEAAAPAIETAESGEKTLKEKIISRLVKARVWVPLVLGISGLIAGIVFYLRGKKARAVYRQLLSYAGEATFRERYRLKRAAVIIAGEMLYYYGLDNICWAIARKLPETAGITKNKRIEEIAGFLDKLNKAKIEAAAVLRYGIPLLAQTARNEKEFTAGLGLLEGTLKELQKRRMDINSVFSYDLEPLKKLVRDFRVFEAFCNLAKELAARKENSQEIIRSVIPQALKEARDEKSKVTRLRLILNLLLEGIHPTQLLIEALEKTTSQSSLTAELSQWSRLLNDFKTGAVKFDFNNPLHIDLEYTTFRQLAAQLSQSNTYENYQSIIQQFRSQSGSPSVLAAQEQSEIKLAVYEAYRLLEFIIVLKQRADALGRPLWVVPNLSYGKFAVSPILDELARLNVEVRYARVGSSESHEHPELVKPALFTDDVYLRILKERPVLVVVDGTQHLLPRPEEKKSSRYPDAYVGYRNFVAAIDEVISEKKEEKFLDKVKISKDFLGRLKANPDYAALVDKLEKLNDGLDQPEALYRLEFWNPAGMQSVIREARKEVQDVPSFNPNDLDSPALIFVNSPLKDEDVPADIKQWAGLNGVHLPAFFDDRAQIQQTVFAVNGRGVYLSHALDFEISRACREIKDNYQGKLPQVVYQPPTPESLRSAYEAMLFDLDGTLTDTLSEIDKSLLNKLLYFLSSGVVIGIVTSQNLDEVKKYILDKVDADKTASLHSLVVYTARGAQAWSFDQDRNPQLIYDRAQTDLNDQQKQLIRQAVNQALGSLAGDSEITDRQAQLTLRLKKNKDKRDLVNATLNQLIANNNLPFQTEYSGSSTIHVVMKGIDKGTAKDYFLNQIIPQRLNHPADLSKLLVVGDRFQDGGSDRPMVVPGARVISVGGKEKSIPAGVEVYPRHGWKGTNQLLGEVIQSSGRRTVTLPSMIIGFVGFSDFWQGLNEASQGLYDAAKRPLFYIGIATLGLAFIFLAIASSIKLYQTYRLYAEIKQPLNFLKGKDSRALFREISRHTSWKKIQHIDPYELLADILPVISKQSNEQRLREILNTSSRLKQAKLNPRHALKYLLRPISQKAGGEKPFLISLRAAEKLALSLHDKRYDYHRLLKEIMPALAKTTRNLDELNEAMLLGVTLVNSGRNPAFALAKMFPELKVLAKAQADFRLGVYALQQLCLEGFEPTKYLLGELVKQGQAQKIDQSIAIWQGIRRKFKSGEIPFNPKNQLHMNLEYTTFRELVDRTLKQAHKYSFSEYQEILKNFNHDRKRARLGRAEKAEIRFAAYEAFRLRQFVLAVKKQASKMNRKVWVVPNLSYGRFAVSPMVKDLAGDGVEIHYARIGSSESHDNPNLVKANLFNAKLYERIINEQPIIIVVDGTQHLLARPKDRKSARYPDAYVGYRNLIVAVNDILSRGQEQVFKRNVKTSAHFIRRLRKKPDYRVLRRRLLRLYNPNVKVKRYLYDVEFWNPGGLELVVREARKEVNRVKPVSPSQINQPTLIFVNSVMLDEDIPVFIHDWITKGRKIRHRPAYFDDTSRIQDLIFNVDAFGVNLSDAIYANMRKEYKRIKGVYRPEFSLPANPQNRAKLPYKAVISDLDGTLSDTLEDVPQPVMEKLLYLLSLGLQVAIVTTQSYQELEKYFLSRVPAKQKALLSNLSIYAATGSQGFGFDKNGNPLSEPLYDARDVKLTEGQMQTWRQIIKALSEEYGLDKEVKNRKNQVVAAPARIIDAGSQIIIRLKERGFLRREIAKRLRLILNREQLPIVLKEIGGTSIRMTIRGIDKSLAVEYHLGKVCKERFGFEPKPGEVLILGNSFDEDGDDRDLMVKGAKTFSVGSRSLSRQLKAGINFYPERGWKGSDQLLAELISVLSLEKKPAPQKTAQSATFNSFVFLPFLAAGGFFENLDPFTSWAIGCISGIAATLLIFKQRIFGAKEVELEDIDEEEETEENVPGIAARKESLPVLLPPVKKTKKDLDAIASRIRQDYPGIKIGVLGAALPTKGYLPIAGIELGRKLREYVQGRGFIFTGGVGGVGVDIYRGVLKASYGKDERFFTLLPEGVEPDYGYESAAFGRKVKVAAFGQDMFERRIGMGKIADVLIVLNGREGTLHEAVSALENGKKLIVLNYAGAGSLLYQAKQKESVAPALLKLGLRQEHLKNIYPAGINNITAVLDNVLKAEQEPRLLSGDFMEKALFTKTARGEITLNAQALSAVNSLSAIYGGLTLEIDVDTLIDTARGQPQLKGIGFKEAVASLYQAQEKKEIPENLRIRLININPALNKEKIIKVLGLTDNLLKSLVAIPDIPQDYVIRSLEPYLIKDSIRVIFEDNVKYWGKKVDVLVKRGQESETLSSLGLIVAALAKEPKFYASLPQEIKDYIVAVTDEKGNLVLDDDNKIKQLIFKPIEKTKVDTQYLEQLDKANKELEGMV